MTQPRNDDPARRLARRFGVDPDEHPGVIGPPRDIRLSGKAEDYAPDTRPRDTRCAICLVGLDPKRKKHPPGSDEYAHPNCLKLARTWSSEAVLRHWLTMGGDERRRWLIEQLGIDPVRVAQLKIVTDLVDAYEDDDGLPDRLQVTRHHGTTIPIGVPYGYWHNARDTGDLPASFFGGR